MLDIGQLEANVTSVMSTVDRCVMTTMRRGISFQCGFVRGCMTWQHTAAHGHQLLVYYYPYVYCPAAVSEIRPAGSYQLDRV